jgi:hypothetical protein
MPETAVAPQSLPSPHSQVGSSLTWTIVDSVNGNSVVASPLIVLIVRNPSGSSKSITVTSQPDPVYGRTGNVSTSIASGASKLFQLTSAGWANTDGLILFTGGVDLEVAILKVA